MIKKNTFSLKNIVSTHCIVHEKFFINADDTEKFQFPTFHV